MEKTPPHDIDLEKTVLGTILVEPSVFPIVAKFIRTDSFYLESHKIIFWAFTEILKNSKYVDLVLLVRFLKDVDRLEQAGGSYNISNLMDMIGTSVNIESHCMILAELHIKREIIKTCQNAINQVYDNDEITEIYGKATSSLDLVFDIKNMDAVFLGKVMESRINDLSKLQPGKITGIMTGISNLDNSFGGWQNGDMVVIAARPSMGKTAISLYFSKIAVMQQSKRLLYFSLEMPSYRLADRILSLETGINSELLQNGRIQDKEWLTLYEVADKYNNSNFVINDQAGLTIEQIIAMSIIENRKAKVDMIVIDYMQLIGYTFKDKRTTNDQVSHISKNVKKLAKILNIPVIALAQLNRDCEKRSDKRPELSDLRDSGSIEQDADVVAFLYRDEHYNPESEAINIIEVIFRKNRNGRIGTEFLHKSNDWSYISDKPLTIWSESIPEF